MKKLIFVDDAEENSVVKSPNRKEWVKPAIKSGKLNRIRRSYLAPLYRNLETVYNIVEGILYCSSFWKLSKPRLRMRGSP